MKFLIEITAMTNYAGFLFLH